MVVKGKDDTRDEYVTIKVHRSVKEALIQLQGLLQYKLRRRVSLSDIIAYAIQRLPPLEIELTEGPVTLEPIEEKKERGEV